MTKRNVDVRVLLALNWVLVVVRQMLRDGAPAREIEELVDAIEAIPAWLAGEKDATKLVEATFRDLAKQYPSTARAYELLGDPEGGKV